MLSYKADVAFEGGKKPANRFEDKITITFIFVKQVLV